MPTKRQALEQLKRGELIIAAPRFELPVADRRVRDLLIGTLASSRPCVGGGGPRYRPAVVEKNRIG